MKVTTKGNTTLIEVETPGCKNERVLIEIATFHGQIVHNGPDFQGVRIFVKEGHMMGSGKITHIVNED